MKTSALKSDIKRLVFIVAASLIMARKLKITENEKYTL